MNRPSTAREALIAEALGEVAELIDRVEAVAPAMEDARLSLVQVHANLAHRIVAFDQRMAAITEQAKEHYVRHIEQRTNEAAWRAVEMQKKALAEAAQAIFQAEMRPTLQHLVMPLQQLIERLDRPWERWLIHMATVAATSSVTWLLATWLSSR